MFKWILVRTAHADESAGKPVVVFETTQGTMEVELWQDMAPKTCEK